MMKANALPPCRAKLSASHIILNDDDRVTAWEIIREVAGEYRLWGRIAAEVQRDLLRFHATNGIPVYVGLEGHTPFFYFKRAQVTDWLDAGGRSWIIADMEARASKRVIAFPGRRS